jgi:hypothetical protein
MDLVIERVESSPGIGLGRPVKRSPQFSDLVLLDGPSHDLALTDPSLCVTHGRSSGPSLTAGSVVPTGSIGVGSGEAAVRVAATSARPSEPLVQFSRKRLSPD